MKQIELVSKTYGTHYLLVDDEDYEECCKQKITLKKHRNTYYGKRHIKGAKVKGSRVYIHRLVLGVTDPKIQIDHMDHNGLNCQKSNLRVATHLQNMRNRNADKNSSSKFVGVHVAKSKSGNPKSLRYVAQIKADKSRYLGTFPYTPEGEIMAAMAYDRAAKEWYGEFANSNFK